MTPELLAPAGSPEKLDYAFAYGADAVYAGIPKFSLRAKENLFRDDSLKQAIETTHRLGKKIYITANILPPNRKVDSFKKSLAYYAEAGADAFIMSDPGLIQFVRKEFPQTPVHLSVQTNTINWPSVQFWHDLGVRRTILSRELSLEEVRGIHEKVPGMELEILCSRRDLHRLLGAVACCRIISITGTPTRAPAPTVAGGNTTSTRKSRKRNWGRDRNWKEISFWKRPSAPAN